MTSIAKIAVAFVITFVASVYLLAATHGRAAIELGAEHRAYVAEFERRLDKRVDGRAIVAWLGDSTIYPRPGHPTYPDIIRARLDRALKVGTLSVAKPGLDFYHYYSLTSRVLDREPAVILYIANPRLFSAVSPMEARNDLCSFIEPSELARAALLPWHARGMTVPRVLGCRLLARADVRTATFFVDGMRRSVREAELWGEARPPATKALYRRQMALLRAAYDTPIGPYSPMTRMLEASVELAARGSARVLVVATPIPFELLEPLGLYDSARFDQRIAVLSEVVERAGGRLIDLHDLLGKHEFRDDAGHFSAQGTRRIADAVLPEIKKELAVLGLTQ